jgi:hypothetical protein
MPRSIPTAAPEAPPLPLSGERMGVGGHPRPTRRVCFSAPLLTLLLTSPAQAQIIPTGSPAADILLSQAIAEHRVFLTCSALDPELHAQITSNWQTDIAAAATILAAKAVPQDAITAFTTAAQPDALLPAPDTPFEDVRQICSAKPDWMAAYFRLNFTVLDLKLPQAFE